MTGPLILLVLFGIGMIASAGITIRALCVWPVTTAVEYRITLGVIWLIVSAVGMGSCLECVL